MNTQNIFEIITGHVREVIPALQVHEFRFDDTLKALGANSIDRSEIVMMTLESLSLNIRLVETAGAESIGELADLLHAKLRPN
jgi:polyketide biosynthesis acyl carrier protein